MSWVRLVTLLCDADQCTARYRSAVTDLASARIAAHQRGWSNHPNGGDDPDRDICWRHTEGGTP